MTSITNPACQGLQWQLISCVGRWGDGEAGRQRGREAGRQGGGEAGRQRFKGISQFHFVLSCSNPNLDNSVFPSWFCLVSTTWVLLTGSLYMSLKELSKLGKVNLDSTESFM